jgi:16S rRNA (guanine527-N7)-methyltransferase
MNRLFLFYGFASILFSIETSVCQGFELTRSQRFPPKDSKQVLKSTSSDNENEWGSTSRDFAMDPLSKKAKAIMNHLGLSVEQHQKLAKLAVLVTDWNTRLNLISRRDCSKEVVFGRHIIPSLAPIGLEGENGIIKDNQRVVDVGTGGGFPGLPLAIAYPDVDFLLVDSIGKKLGAVQDMADTLGLTNVRVHHGRAEQLKQKFDVCVGRSVAAIPTYCFWIQDLLEKDGHLQYIIGGEIEKNLLDQSIIDSDVDDLLECPNASDKRVLVFPQASVKKIARASGEKPRVPNQVTPTLGKKKLKKTTKGAWEKRDQTQPKQRGYENFKRYDNLS